ncbi:hypothetical protein I551_5907 [Mycobacterium ulcerans str. Harvey]|uniref:Uncharacterized protein n=1 Tax=Mycobacterium ulcerans str. Harvey TaxID=1299332 RepID=A0ABP3A7X0_MYCUL|nr:hypothetical protein I551_5907 [Mycobacterium ulcerans str. Harvey]
MNGDAEHFLANSSTLLNRPAGSGRTRRCARLQGFAPDTPGSSGGSGNGRNVSAQ